MQIEFVSSIHQVAASHWDRLCSDDYPFVRHAFLTALEDSASVGATAGWQPQHLLAYRGDELVLAMPGYLKTHSYGEYVFDWSWADAYRRHGYEYYPKWVNAIPFTPCFGPRCLTRQPTLAATELKLLFDQINVQLGAGNCSGWHSLFPVPEQGQAWQQAGMHLRLGCQFHWFNLGYENFEGFLAQLNSRKRKNIIKERRQVAEQGIQFRHLVGASIGAAEMEWFYQLYCTTYLKRSGHKGYLTGEFFQQIRVALPDNLLLILAFKAGADSAQAPLAGSLYFRDSTRLYGRYWGCFEEYNFLHFETCYYQGIDFAIAQGLARFDGGAQGEHKIARGFEPVITYSAHWLNHPQFNEAIGAFVREEAEGVLRYAEEAKKLLPFKVQMDEDACT